MKSVLVIGMGRFGRHLATKFAELKNEVMIIDKIEERVNEMAPIVTTAEIGDCTNPEVLNSIGVGNFDVCFVCIGSNFQSSLEVTSLLKELGGKYVVSKAGREIQAKFLLRNGADEVIYPEKDLAEKSAIRFSANHVFDYIELTNEYSIFEILPLQSWLGKTIAEVSIRVKYQMNILAVKVNGELFPLPTADHVFKDDEHLIVAGKKNEMVKFLKKI